MKLGAGREHAAAQLGSNGTSMADSGTCLANNGADSKLRGEGGEEGAGVAGRGNTAGGVAGGWKSTDMSMADSGSCLANDGADSEVRGAGFGDNCAVQIIMLHSSVFVVPYFTNMTCTCAVATGGAGVAGCADGAQCAPHRPPRPEPPGQEGQLHHSCQGNGGVQHGE